MTRPTYYVQATWDAEARVWIAESDDVPGLVAEEPTFDALVRTVKELVPELVTLNHAAPPDGECSV